METVKDKWLWGIFISILSIFAMSYNASATEPVINLNNYSLKFRQNIPITTCTFNDNSAPSSQSDCLMSVGTNGNGLRTILTNTTYTNLKKGEIFKLYYTVYSNVNFETSSLPVRRMFAAPNFVLLSYKEIEKNDFLNEFYGSITDTAGNEHTFIGSNSFQFQYSYEVILMWDGEEGGSSQVGLGDTRQAYNLFYSSDENFLTQYKFFLSNLQRWEFVGSEENREVEEKTQGAVDESQEAGGDSSTDAQTGTTGLISAIGSAVNVIAAASPTNCKINGNMGNLNMGELDLCANPAPAFIQTIGSLILILMCVPLAISLFNRFISLFRSFQS